MISRILYTSFVDVSLPYGPGINERVFLSDMLGRFGSGLHAVIPRPSRAMPVELGSLDATFVSTTPVRRLAGWLQARTSGAVVLSRVVRKFRPDLIVIRPGAFPLSQCVIPWGGVPFVLKTAPDGAHTAFHRKRAVGSLLRGMDQRMLTTLFTNALVIDVVSNTHKEGIVARYPDIESRVHVIDNGVDLKMFSTASARESRYAHGFAAGDIVLGYVGNYPMRRGGKEVISTVAALRSRLPVKGLVVGDGGEAEQCRRYAESLDVDDIVTITGEVDYARVPDLMAAMDIALSILRAGERHASEQKVRQYLASGLCVVGTGGSNDFLRGHDFARVVETEETEEIARAIESLLGEGRTGLARLRPRAQRFAETALSVSSRNDRRLTQWSRALRESVS